MKMGNMSALEAALAVIGMPETIREDEFTAWDYAKKTGLSENRSLRVLGAHAKSGSLNARRVLKDGRWVNAYSLKPPVGNPPKGKKPRVAKG